MTGEAKKFLKTANDPYVSITANETVGYIYDLLSSLQRIATQNEFHGLAHQIDLAKMEAKYLSRPHVVDEGE